MKKTLLFFTLAMLVVGIMVSCNFGYTAKTYKVVYDYGYEYGNKPVIITRVFADGSSAIPMEITRKGYDFDGWYADEEGTQPFDFSAILTEDVTLYAKWTQVLFTVSYDLNGATGTAPNSTMQESKGASVTLAATTTATKTRDASDTTKGYVFAGWNTKADGTGTFYSPGSSYSPEKDITLYAVWQGWVQLWAGGPKFAEFNVGSTISNYATVTGTTDDEKYTTANVGGLYTWSDNPDTATKLWGSDWKMPTKDDLNTLIANCTWTWCDGIKTHYDDIEGTSGTCTLAGYKVSGKTTGYTNNSIFLPAPATEYQGEEYHGSYWLSTPSESGVGEAWKFYVSYTLMDEDKSFDGNAWYTNCYFVRAVLNESTPE